MNVSNEPKYAYLCARMKEEGIDTKKYLAELLTKPPSTVHDRFRGQTAWRVDEMWAVMELIHEPPENFHIVFPPDGRLDANYEVKGGFVNEDVIDKAVERTVRRILGPLAAGLAQNSTTNIVPVDSLDHQ